GDGGGQVLPRAGPLAAHRRDRPRRGRPAAGGVFPPDSQRGARSHGPARHALRPRPLGRSAPHHRTTPMFALVLLLIFPLAQQKGKPDLPDGLTPDQVRARIGAPAPVGRQLPPPRLVEQWPSAAPLTLLLTFACPRGQPPRLARPRPADTAARPD